MLTSVAVKRRIGKAANHSLPAAASSIQRHASAERIFLAKPLAQSSTRRATAGESSSSPRILCRGGAPEPPRRKRSRDPQSLEAPGVVVLVECHRHDELRNSCGERLRRRADSAVVNDGRRPAETSG